jgi:hypothetical protein
MIAARCCVKLREPVVAAAGMGDQPVYSMKKRIGLNHGGSGNGRIVDGRTSNPLHSYHTDTQIG